MQSNINVHKAHIMSGRSFKIFNEKDDGCCHGWIITKISACLLGEEEENVHYQRTKKISKNKLTQKDMPAFFESVAGFQTPQRFHELLNANYTQLNIDELSMIFGSSDLIKKGGLSTIYSAPGIYTKSEIKKYLDEIGEAIDQCGSQTPVALVLDCVDHAIGLTYQSATGWKFADINMDLKDFPSIYFGTNTCDLADKIMVALHSGFNLHLSKNANETFSDKPHLVKTADDRYQLWGYKQDKWQFSTLENFRTPWESMDKTVFINEVYPLYKELNEYHQHPYVAFNTRTIITGNDPKREELTRYLNKLKENQILLITPEMVTREDRVGVLYHAARNGHANWIVPLKNAGADLNANLNKANNNGVTPAIIAAQYGHASFILALSEAGADMDKGDSSGGTPAIRAAQCGHANVILALRAAGADLDKIDSTGGTAAKMAAAQGHANVILALGEAGADLDKADSSGETPAIRASQWGYANVILALWEAGADLNKADSSGGTPAFMAAQQGHDDVIEVLEKAGADLNIALISTVENLQIFAAEEGGDVVTRMNQIIQRQLDAGEEKETISLKPCDMAWIMGHSELAEKIKLHAENKRNRSEKRKSVFADEIPDNKRHEGENARESGQLSP